MKTKYFAALSLSLALSLLLSACGAVASPSWPGLAADDQFAYVAANQQVHIIGLSDGRLARAFPGTPNNNTGLFFATPGVSSGQLAVGSEGPTNSYSGILYGVDPGAATQAWCLAFDQKGAERQACPIAEGSDPNGFLGISPPVDNRIIGGVALVDDVAYFGLASGRVFAVRTGDGGQVLWHFRAQQAVYATPVIEADTVYVTSLDHSIYALNRADGALKWKKDLGAAIAGTPAVVDGSVYIGSFGNRLYALDAATGNERWNAEANFWVWGGPSLQDGVVYFADLAGTVFAVEAATGAEIWEVFPSREGTDRQDVEPGDAITGSPALSGDTLFVGDKGGRLYALSLADGRTRWKQQVEGQLLAAPIVTANDLVLLAPYSGDNLLVAYTTAGALQWAFAPSK